MRNDVKDAQKATLFIPKKVLELDEYVPNSGDFRIRLDANECPFLPTPEIMSELADALKSIEFNRYPDPLATDLLKALSDSYHIPIDELVVGNGSDEIVFGRKKTKKELPSGKCVPQATLFFSEPSAGNTC